MSDLTEFFIANHKLVIKAAREHLPLGWELDDWIQECCMLVWTVLDHYDPAKGRLSTWLYTVIRNHRATVNHSRQFKGRNMRLASIECVIGEQQDGALRDMLPDPSPNHEDAVGLRLDLRHAMAFVSADEQVLFDLKAAGENRGELTRNTNTTKATLNGRWKRARAQVAKTLEAYA
jgi:RNA polymerase sigma-70 factor (ECF subfamily)